MPPTGPRESVRCAVCGASGTAADLCSAGGGWICIHSNGATLRARGAMLICHPGAFSPSGRSRDICSDACLRAVFASERGG